MDRARDTSRFVRYYRLVVENNLFQLYCLSLIFSPIQNFTKLYYQKKKSDWILTKPVVEKDWNLYFQILEGYRDTIFSVVWSQDKYRFVSVLYNNTVKIWDSTLDQYISILEGYGDLVNLIVWSQNRNRFVSVSNDNSVRIWNLDIFQYISILERYSNSVNSIVWLRNRNRFVLVSNNKTVRIWNTVTGYYTTIFKISTELYSSIQ